jgi:hypothetical protein
MATGVHNGKRGMQLLSKEERQEIGKKLGKAAVERKTGWPKSIQKEGIISTYEDATWEWARLMAKSERAHWKTK